MFCVAIFNYQRFILIYDQCYKIHNTLDQENVSNQGCFIYEMDSSSKTLLIPCNYKVNDERCFVWTKTLFNHIEAER